MQATEPKQYLQLLPGKTLMQCTLERLIGLGLRRIILAVAPGDARVEGIVELLPPNERQRVEIMETGGGERADTVLNTLQALQPIASDDDLVLVHDLARPCLCQGDLDAVLTAAAAASSFGAILGTPVSDTLKRCAPDDGRGTGLTISKTVPRDRLWRALTPQVMRYRVLCQSLAEANRLQVTDEASALEQSGHRVQMVAGRSDNIKVTQPEDLALAGFIYRQQLKAGTAFEIPTDF